MRQARAAAALALVLAAAAWLHGGSLAAPFFADDYLFLDQVHGRGPLESLARPDPLGNFLRPVSRQLWFWMLGTASGASPRAFHLANLALFLAALALLHRVARRLLPAAAALAGVAVVGVHHAADVPLLWASGSQDLLAVLGALAAIELHAAGRRWWAALAFALALLSKETVVFAPFVALALAARPGERWSAAARRAWPLLATLGVWALAWVATAARRPAIGSEVHVEPAGLAAVLVHLAQTAAGIEWPLGGLARAFHAAPPLALVAALAGIALVAFAPRDTPAAAGRARAVDRRRALWVGLTWAVLGALPVVAVASIWSAYYYLFALCGVALMVGALVAPLPPWAALLPALLVGVTSENSRRLPEFAITRGPWTWQSHLNRHYFQRGMTLVQRCLADLRRARPTLPARSTLFFAGLPPAIAFQAGDGPLLRWAYRDTSLRSYYLTGLRLEHARRGPLFFFRYDRDTLAEITGPDSLERIGASLMLTDATTPARDALALAWRARPVAINAYRLAWASAMSEGLGAARGWLERAGVGIAAGPTPEIPMAFERVTRGDTTGALALMSGGVARHALDPGAHALMADLLLAIGEMDSGTLEAYAARALAPSDPMAWRRWGMVQAVQHRDQEAVASLARYFELAGIREADDPEVAAALRTLRRKIPGGDVAQKELGSVGR